MALFQHTAARRRLALSLVDSTSRFCFNTQPPEGGWGLIGKQSRIGLPFQHTAARRRLGKLSKLPLRALKFQHTAARRRLETETAKTKLSLMFQHTAARRRLGNHRKMQRQSA